MTKKTSKGKHISKGKKELELYREALEPDDFERLKKLLKALRKPVERLKLWEQKLDRLRDAMLAKCYNYPNDPYGWREIIERGPTQEEDEALRQDIRDEIVKEIARCGFTGFEKSMRGWIKRVPEFNRKLGNARGGRASPRKGDPK